MGPNQGAGVPAEYDADGIQWDLQPFNTTVPIGGHFNDILPGWGTGQLVSASSGLVKSMTNISSAVSYTLVVASLQDLTSNVSPNGSLNITFPSNTTGLHYTIFAYYLVHTEHREQQSPFSVAPDQGVPQSPVTSYVQNGSWVVDHFSLRGAQQTTRFWQEHLLSEDSIRLINEVGNFVWEDSQEFPSNIFWTPGVQAAFLGMHGYPINQYIPLLMHDNGGGLNIASKPPAFYTDEPDRGAQRIADFRSTVSVGAARTIFCLT